MYTRVILHISVVLMTIRHIQSQKLSLNNNFHFQKDIREGMLDRLMVPYFLDEAPTEMCSVIYEDFAEAGAGNVYLNRRTVEKPAVSWKCENSTQYTLTLTNLVTINDGFRFEETHHWMVTNIPGCQIEKGNELLPYEKPINPKVDEYYLYVLLIFKQKEHIDFKLNPSLRDNQTRTSFKIKDFADIYEIDPPQAGSFFYLYEPDDYEHFLQLQNIEKHLGAWDNIKP